MRGYRCYLMDSSKHIRAVREFVCPSDEEAKTKAAEFAREQPHLPRLELWSGPELLWYGHHTDL
jgi:hypothetical protein